MIPTQVLKNCLDELKSISNVEFCLVDSLGTVISATAGMRTPEPSVVSAFASSPADSQIIGNVILVKVEDEEERGYILASCGDESHVLLVTRLAKAEVQNLLVAYKEKYDRNNFFQNLLLDNLLLVDIYNRAKKLHIDGHTYRGIIVIEKENSAMEKLETGDISANQLLSGLFTVQSGDYLTAVDETSLVLVKALSGPDDYETLQEAAEAAVNILNTEAMLKVKAAYGTIVGELKDLSKAYKEAKMAMDVGRIFYADKSVTSYTALGIGRLIYQLPVSLCRMFLKEVFEDVNLQDLDEETYTTISNFFENNLNVSETSRQLYVHRNTLVYRIEKLNKLTGLDIRNFDDALTFKIALMVSSYLKYIDNSDNI